MTLREAMDSPHEPCPVADCTHPLSIYGRHACSLGREALFVLVTRALEYQKAIDPLVGDVRMQHFQ